MWFCVRVQTFWEKYAESIFRVKANLSCKANARVLLTKTGHGPQLSVFIFFILHVSLLILSIVMCYSVYRLYIILCTVYLYSVYSITATGCQPICSLLIIIK